VVFLVSAFVSEVLLSVELSAAMVVDDIEPLAEAVVIILFKSELSLFLQPTVIIGSEIIAKYKNNLFILPP